MATRSSRGDLVDHPVHPLPQVFLVHIRAAGILIGNRRAEISPDSGGYLTLS
jgi:hypothetical protein